MPNMPAGFVDYGHNFDMSGNVWGRINFVLDFKQCMAGSIQGQCDPVRPKPILTLIK